MPRLFSNPDKSLCRLSRNRLFRCLRIALLAGALCAAPAASAQFKFRQPPGRQSPSELSDHDGKRLWQDFQTARHLGSFSLSGILTYRPAGDASTHYQFQLDGRWNTHEQLSELDIAGPDGVRFNRRVAVRDGTVYLADGTGCGAGETVVEGADMSEPLVEGLPFTWNDLLMPYLKWSNVSYLGPDRYLGRPAHRYLLAGDDREGTPASVVVTLDEDYAVMLKSDVLDKDDTIIKRIRVGGFRQFGEEWMFSELVWEHRIARESVLLKVSDFSFGR